MTPIMERSALEMPIHAYLRKRLADGLGGNISRFAEALSTTPSMASKWVSEDPRRRVTPSPTSCRKIAAGLHVDEDYLLSLAGHRGGVTTAPSEQNPQLAALFAAIESGWLVMDAAAREVAERGTRALYSTTRRNGNLVRHKTEASDQRHRESRSVKSLVAQFGFQPLV